MNKPYFFLNSVKLVYKYNHTNFFVGNCSGLRNIYIQLMYIIYTCISTHKYTVH